MKFWKRLPLGQFVLLVLFIGIGFILPGSQHTERTVVVRRKREEVFSLVAMLRSWRDWTAWATNRLPDMTLRFAGPESGVGVTMFANGESSGAGTVTVTQADSVFPARGAERRCHARQPQRVDSADHGRNSYAAYGRDRARCPRRSNRLAAVLPTVGAMTMAGFDTHLGGLQQ